MPPASQGDRHEARSRRNPCWFECDPRYRETVDALPPKTQQAAYQTQEQYWNRVEQLRARTKGFWEPADVQELEQLKRDRTEALENLKHAAP